MFVKECLLTSSVPVGRTNETLFIINTNLDIITGTSTPLIRHVSLSRGSPVFGGGMLIVNNGKVEHIKGNSGHYLFYTPHMLQTIYILQKKGVFLDENVKITNFTSFYDTETLLVQEFLEKYQQRRKNAYQRPSSDYSR